MKKVETFKQFQACEATCRKTKAKQLKKVIAHVKEVVAKEEVVDVVTRGVDDPIAPASVGDPIKEAGSVALPSHSSESGSGHFRGGGEIYAHSLGENELFAFLY